MRVLVTGAAGFVGSHLVPRLARDHEVIALVRRHPDHELPTAKTIVADLSTPTFPARLPRDIDVIVHLAQAYKTFPEHAGDIFSVNATSTQRLADHARAAGVRRFILASTGSVYAPGPDLLTESSTPQPMGFHPATKLIAEQLLSYYAGPLETLILRLFAPYGPGQVDRMIPRLVDSVRSGNPITISRGGEPRMKPIYIADLVEVFAQGVDGRGAGVVNVAGPAVAGIRDIAEVAGDVLGRRPVYQDRDQERSGDLIADTTKMAALFELPNMVNLRDGLAQTVQEHSRRA